MGSLAEWFAAIGTVGTLAMTLVLYGRDRKREAESIALELVAHWTVAGEMYYSDEELAAIAEDGPDDS